MIILEIIHWVVRGNITNLLDLFTMIGGCCKLLVIGMHWNGMALDKVYDVADFAKDHSNARAGGLRGALAREAVAWSGWISSPSVYVMSNQVPAC